MMDITLIGTGALQPLPGRALASAAITLAGHVLLLDCGEGTQAAAKGAGVSLMKIDAIALTHYHGDHTYGLPGLLQSMGMAGRTEPVTILGPKGLEDEMKPFLMLCPYLPYELRLCELPEEGLSLHTLNAAWPEQAYIRPFATVHKVVSQGYRIDLKRPGKFLPQKAKALGVPVQCYKLLQRGESIQVGEFCITPEQVMGEPRRGISVAYTGDTAMCASVLDAAQDTDLLICEATYGENEQETLANDHGHMTFSQAARLAKQAHARVLWLTHYSPMILDAQEYVSNAEAIFENAKCGQDGMKVTLRFDEENT
ncbi:MAG: ribonuclease Z [Clostridia bacterium]|nr:ribonuclease Z [Clostridia bacterium]